MKKLLPFLFLLPTLLLAQVDDYEHREIEGYNVYIELDALNNHPEVTEDATNLVTAQLKEINGLGLKKEILDSLQAVRIFMDWNTTNGGAGYHPSLAWLIENGYHEEKEKSIEISNLTNYVNWTRQNQPAVMIHEMTHAYHDRVLGYGYAPITEAYNRAMQDSLYENVSYHAGNGQYFNNKAYATTNAIEYFAEITEAYLSTNDFFPFIRKELEMHDTLGYNVVLSVWQFESSTSVAPIAQREEVILYPNPTRDLLQIKWDDTSQPDVIRLMDPNGRLLKQYDANGFGTATLDLSGLPSGIYFVALNNGSFHKIAKLE